MRFSTPVSVTAICGFLVLGCSAEDGDAAGAVGIEALAPVPSDALEQTNLVSDQPGVAAVQDVGLVGAWGISLSPTGGAFWVSANKAGLVNLYSGDVNGSPLTKATLTVAVPGGAVTGQVFNLSDDFFVSNGINTARAIFIFASEAGLITGWNPTVSPMTSAHVGASVPGAVYTGLAIANTAAGNFLYATDFGNGKIDVFNGSFSIVTLAGSFDTPNVPGSYRPFNIQNLGGKLYVTYAKHNGAADVAEHGGLGFVNVFDTDGNFLQALASGGKLRAPWGLALAPANFGSFSNALLVGNFTSGQIGAYNSQTGEFLGPLRDSARRPIEIDGLLGLAFGNGLTAGDKDTLYFAAAPDVMTDGLFGSLRVSQ